MTYVTESNNFSKYYLYMKLRIHGNSIRLRLSQADVAAFAESGRAEAYLEFPDGSRLTYTLAATDAVLEPEARFEDHCITVYVPKARADAWVNSDAVAITDRPVGDTSGPEIIVEKDFACLHKRAGEGDADTFPNPSANRLF